MTDSRLEIWNLICQSSYLKDICRLCEDATVYLESKVEHKNFYNAVLEERNIICEELAKIDLRLAFIRIDSDCVSGYVEKLT